MANQPKRIFTNEVAKRSEVLLQLGLVGPSGSGKTFSALRLGTGMVKVLGGDLHVIDTENRRALEYADRFRFRHVPMPPPHGSLDYLEAMNFCVTQGARVVVVDSMTHEHNGVGGMLEQHGALLEQFAAADNQPGAMERHTMRAWARVKPQRTMLIQRMVQMPVYFILCFWAKDTTRPVKTIEGNRTKTEMVHMGYQPLGGDEFVFFLTARMLLPPGAGGVPDWSKEAWQGGIPKLGAHLQPLFTAGQPLDEDMGQRVARWAKGEVMGESPAPKAAAGPQEQPAAAVAGPELAALYQEIEDSLWKAAGSGLLRLQREWESLAPKHQKHFEPMLKRLKERAQRVEEKTA